VAAFRLMASKERVISSNLPWGVSPIPATSPSGKAMTDSVIVDARPAATLAEARHASLTASRLSKHADYQRAYAAGRKRRSVSMSWFLAPQTVTAAGPRVGLTVGKVIGKAHERNRIKRRLREVLRRHVALLPLGCDLILHPHRSVLTLEFTKLDAEIVRILSQANAEAARGIQISTPHPATAKPVR
jgi:ribonuclease P protein component